MTANKNKCAIYLEEDTGVGIYVGPRVLDFAGFHENRRHDLVNLGDQLEKYDSLK